ncbi:MAG: hypothetical protein WDW36_002158 [Sanguina aurantia]
MGDYASLQETAKLQLKDASRVLLFDASGVVLVSTFEADPAELKLLAQAVADRDMAIRGGLQIQGIRYEVHRHYPPLVYGRTMGDVPEDSEGVAICRLEDGITRQPIYGLITYSMPNISARMVPLLQQFCTQHLTASPQ